jgi:hypothetical protein
MNEFTEKKIEHVIHECIMHQNRIEYALTKLKTFMPLNIQSYKNLTDEQVEALDQFLFRFSKLQDAMGQRLFTSVLEMLEEPVKEMSFLDRLNKLEQLMIIDSKEQWLMLRNMRNNLAHEYEDNAAGMCHALNNVYAAYSTLTAIFVKINNFIADKRK